MIPVPIANIKNKKEQYFDIFDLPELIAIERLGDVLYEKGNLETISVYIELNNKIHRYNLFKFAKKYPEWVSKLLAFYKNKSCSSYISKFNSKFDLDKYSEDICIHTFFTKHGVFGLCEDIEDSEDEFLEEIAEHKNNNDALLWKMKHFLVFFEKKEKTNHQKIENQKTRNILIEIYNSIFKHTTIEKNKNTIWSTNIEFRYFE